MGGKSPHVEKVFHESKTESMNLWIYESLNFLGNDDSFLKRAARSGVRTTRAFWPNITAATRRDFFLVRFWQENRTHLPRFTFFYVQKQHLLIVMHNSVVCVFPNFGIDSVHLIRSTHVSVVCNGVVWEMDLGGVFLPLMSDANPKRP